MSKTYSPTSCLGDSLVSTQRLGAGRSIWENFGGCLRIFCFWTAYKLVVVNYIPPARDPVLKDQVLSGNITHSKHGHVTKKRDPVLNGECSPFKTGSFFLVTWPCFEWVILPLKTWSFKTGSCAGRSNSSFVIVKVTINFSVLALVIRQRHFN